MARVRAIQIAYTKPFLTFCIIGGLSTGIQFGVLGALVELFSLSPVVGSSIGYCTSALVNYALNYRFTFASDLPHAATLPRFALVSTTGLAINAGLMALLVNVLGANYWIAQVLSTGVVLVWNFGVNLVWSFRRPQRSHTAIT